METEDAQNANVLLKIQLMKIIEKFQNENKSNSKFSYNLKESYIDHIKFYNENRTINPRPSS